MRDEVTLHVDAPVEAVWDLVSDVTRVGEYSPETFEAEWLGGATGPAEGATFRGHVLRNGRPPAYWTTCRVTACQPGRAFGFAVTFQGKDINNWHYRLAPAGTGTDLTESFFLTPSGLTRVYWALLGRWRGPANRRNLRHSLERIRAVAEERSRT